MPYKSRFMNHFSQQLETFLYEQDTTPPSYLEIHRARKERRLVQSIRHRLKKNKHILRVTDKSGIFHIGHAQDYERKAEAYRQRTGAYVELANDPLWSVFDEVVHLLNDLYLYFIPKPHKVKKLQSSFFDIMISFARCDRKVHH